MDGDSKKSLLKRTLGGFGSKTRPQHSAEDAMADDDRYAPKYTDADYDTSDRYDFSGDRYGRPEDIRPNFTEDALSKTANEPKATVEGMGSKPTSDDDKTRNSSASAELRDAENAAASQGSTSSLDAQTGENEVSSSHTNNVGKGGSVKGDDGGDKKKSSSNALKGAGGFIKNKGPLVAVIMTLAMGGGGMYLSQAALPFTMLDKLNGLFDTTNTSTEMRSAGLTKRMMRNTRFTNTTAVTKKNIFGKEKFKPTGKMKRKLSKQGITFSGGKMVYKDKNGATSLLSVKEFKTKLDTDNDFRAAYTKGTKNWRTSVAEFKDKMYNKLLTKFGLSKNRHSGYNAEDDPDGSKARKQMAEDADSASDVDSKSRSATATADRDVSNDIDVVDSNGNATGTKRNTTDIDVDTDEGSENFKANKDPHGVSSKLSSVKKVVGGLTSVGCGITKALSALTVILAGMQILQVMTVAQEIFEGIDKARTEDANSSPINAIGKALTMKVSETRVSVKNTTVNGDDVDTEYEETTEAPRSAVQSEGLSSLYTGDKINGDDESVAGFNPSTAADHAINDVFGSVTQRLQGEEGNFGTILGVISKLTGSIASMDLSEITGFARKSYVHCIQIEAALAMLDVIIDASAVVEAILGIFTGGATAALAVAQELAWSAIQGLLVALVGLAISALIAWVTPMLINMFARKLTTEFAGEDLGNALYAGGSVNMSWNHRAGGGIIANKEGYLASLIYNEKTINETARNERLAHNPFDYTSGYTFAGQLASAIIPVTLQSESLLDSFGNFSSVVRKSVGSIFPGASAASAADKANYAEAYTEKYCSDLAGIGAVADAFCNPYVTTDFSTMDTEADDAALDDDSYDYDSDEKSAYGIMKKVASKGGFEDSDIDEVENPKIDLDSDLGRFIVYCGQRNSPFGQPDQNIASEVSSGHSTGNIALDTATGMIPVFGSAMNFLTSKDILGNYGWVDGSNCVMGHEKSSGDLADIGVEKVDYEDIKYYSRYAEDQRLATAMGAVEQSAVDVALEEYYAEHPLDNSPEGILARFSGMTKENVIATLDTIEFYTWLAQYDPTDMYPTPVEHEEDPDYRFEDNRFLNDDGLLAVIQQGFDNVYRQRNFATA